jgi:hypothetical protein
MRTRSLCDVSEKNEINLVKYRNSFQYLFAFFTNPQISDKENLNTCTAH